MKVLMIEAADEEAAQLKLASDLGIGIGDLKCVRTQNRKFSFEILNCPARIEVEIARDGMKAILKRVLLPIGNTTIPLDVNFIVDQLKAKGVKAGIKRDVISQEVFKILKTPGYDESKILSIVVAEGQMPVTATTGRPKWAIDLKLFEKGVPLYAKKGEVLARAPHAVPGKDGFKVTGEIIKAPVDEQFRLNVGAGILTQSGESEILYVTQTFGRLFYDQGIRLRLETKIIDQDGGMAAAIETGKTSFSGATIKADDLLDMAKSQRIVFGFLNPAEIEDQLKSAKKWPAQIVVARGRVPTDGTYGEIKYKYRESSSTQVIDTLKVKAAIVFPGEVIAEIAPPKEPISGQTVFGEALRGKPVDGLPIYPGKNVNREKVDQTTVLKAASYGRVKVDKDRISVENVLKVSADKMKASLELFPQKPLSVNDLSNMLREADILMPLNRDDIEKRLGEVFLKAERVEDFLVVEGIPPQAGTDAKVIYRFSPDLFKEKGLFQKKTDAALFAIPGDLIMTKILPLEAREGLNIYREKLPVPKSGVPKDIEVLVGDGVDELQVGREGDPKDQLRLEYRSNQIGILSWKDRKLDVLPVIEVDKNEKFAALRLAGRSDFGTQVTEDVLKKIAEAEGIRAELNWAEIRPALAIKRNPGDPLPRVVIVKAKDPIQGVDAKVDYFVDYNGEPIQKQMGPKADLRAPVKFLDCVRPRDVLAIKTPVVQGEDGYTIFGRKIIADRGRDEVWPIGEGIERTADGNQIICNTKAPGYVILDRGKICVRSMVKVASDKMSASVSLYPSQNPRFPLKEDKVLAMLHDIGVREGIKTQALAEAIQKVNSEKEPIIDFVVAEGTKAQRGQDGSFVTAVDVGSTVGEIRADGSVDFKSRNIFVNVKKGQLLLIKRPPTMGEDGKNVMGARVPAAPGADARLDPRDGVEVVGNGLEYRATVDGVLEIKNKSVRVIEGLMIGSDISFKTGHINGGHTNVFVKGAVLPDFQVHSEADVMIDQIAEGCIVNAGRDSAIKGGILGRDRAIITVGRNLETLYISGGATVNVQGNLIVGTEILNSKIRVAGKLECWEGAGTVSGGEIHVFEGMKVKTLGSSGAESQTTVYLGHHYFRDRQAQEEIKRSGLDVKIIEAEKKLADLQKELLAFSEAPTDGVGRDFQEKYMKALDQKKQFQDDVQRLKAEQDMILSSVPINKDCVLTVTEMIYPGVTIIYRDVVWTLKEPQRGVEIVWNPATSNIISRRLSH